MVVVELGYWLLVIGCGGDVVMIMGVVLVVGYCGVVVVGLTSVVRVTILIVVGLLYLSVFLVGVTVVQIVVVGFEWSWLWWS